MLRRWPLRANVLSQLDSKVILIIQAAAIGVTVTANVHLGVFLIQIEIDGVFGQIIVAVYNSRTIGCNRCCIARHICVILHGSVRRRRDGRTHNTRSLFRFEIGIRGVIVFVKRFFQIDNVVLCIACGPLGVNHRIGRERQLFRSRRCASFIQIPAAKNVAGLGRRGIERRRCGIASVAMRVLRFAASKVPLPIGPEPTAVIRRRIAPNRFVLVIFSILRRHSRMRMLFLCAGHCRGRRTRKHGYFLLVHARLRLNIRTTIRVVLQRVGVAIVGAFNNRRGIGLDNLIKEARCGETFFLLGVKRRNVAHATVDDRFLDIVFICTRSVKLFSLLNNAILGFLALDNQVDANLLVAGQIRNSNLLVISNSNAVLRLVSSAYRKLVAAFGTNGHIGTVHFAIQNSEVNGLLVNANLLGVALAHQGAIGANVIHRNDLLTFGNHGLRVNLANQRVRAEVLRGKSIGRGIKRCNRRHFIKSVGHVVHTHGIALQVHALKVHGNRTLRFNHVALGIGERNVNNNGINHFFVLGCGGSLEHLLNGFVFHQRNAHHGIGGKHAFAALDHNVNAAKQIKEAANVIHGERVHGRLGCRLRCSRSIGRGRSFASRLRGSRRLFSCSCVCLGGFGCRGCVTGSSVIGCGGLVNRAGRLSCTLVGIGASCSVRSIVTITSRRGALGSIGSFGALVVFRGRSAFGIIGCGRLLSFGGGGRRFGCNGNRLHHKLRALNRREGILPARIRRQRATGVRNFGERIVGTRRGGVIVRRYRERNHLICRGGQIAQRINIGLLI